MKIDIFTYKNDKNRKECDNFVSHMHIYFPLDRELRILH